ncbi:hypothetical protein [Streptomyces sp. NPDC057689]|uniref:hypothetical protein n=1 Tax=Streptomyces sp. NPDC057689 TaxID=3346213 RepID=UPI003681233E
MLPVAPPPIAANELRPGRFWYAVAAVTAVALIALGVIGGVSRFNDVTDAVDTGRSFSDGETVSIRLGPESDRTIWIKDQGPSDSQKCSITGPGDPGLDSPAIDFFLTRDATWNPLYDIHVKRSGTYELTCSSDGPSEYAVGDHGGIVTFLGGAVLAIVLSVLGVGIAAVIVLVTAIRRRAHRKRLLAERRDAGAQPGPTPAVPAPAPADGEHHPTV